MRTSVVVICGTLIFLIMAAYTHNKGSFLLSNKSKESIAQALVTVCGQTIELKRIQPSNSASGSYDVKSDSHYDVRVEFDSGKNSERKLAM